MKEENTLERWQIRKMQSRRREKDERAGNRNRPDPNDQIEIMRKKKK